MKTPFRVWQVDVLGAPKNSTGITGLHAQVSGGRTSQAMLCLIGSEFKRSGNEDLLFFHGEVHELLQNIVVVSRDSDRPAINEYGRCRVHFQRLAKIH